MTLLEKVIGSKDVGGTFDFITKAVIDFFKENEVQEWKDFYYGTEVDCADSFDGYVEDGASKVVLIPDNVSYVIKIPFYGECGWDEGEVYPYMGAVSPLIETDEPNNYCALESAIYLEAMDWGIEKFFVPTVYIGDVFGVPIYVQTRIKNVRHMTDKENTFKYASIKGSDEFDSDVGAQLVEFYSLEEVETLLRFLKSYHINDVDNFRNGGYDPSYKRHVFWDYAGFNN